MSQGLIELLPLLFAVVMLPPLCIGVTRAAAEGRLPYNGGVGIRTRKTTQSTEAWRAGRQAALPIVGWLWWVAGLAVVLAIAVQWWAGSPWGVVAGLVGLGLECAVLFRATQVAGQAADRA